MSNQPESSGPKMDPWSRAVIEQNRRWLMAFLLAATGDAGAAEDLVQDVFRIAFEKRHAFTPGTNFGGWMRSIAQNCLKQHFERTNRSPVMGGRALERLEKAASRAEDRLLDESWVARRLAALRECLQKLGDRARRILRLRYGEGLSSERAAATCGMNISALNVSAFRARTALSECVRRKLGS